MDVIDCIKERRSIRSFERTVIDAEKQKNILEAAICAPSGKNRQPWKFSCVTDVQMISQLSHLSAYESWMRSAPLFILVFLDKHLSYDYVKDVQSCGAAIQNMLLAATSLGISSCWIGEIVSKQDQIKSLLKIKDDSLELMGLIVFGYSSEKPKVPRRRDLNSFLIDNY
ncbi:MAG: nitroreductase family protein [Clostridia bacterium]|nr:nitroreductase family protein [Clostridia bacterium]